MDASGVDGLLSTGMLFDMTMGMAIGMVASPLMMRAIKVIRKRRKLQKLLDEIAQMRKDSTIDLASG